MKVIVTGGSGQVGQTVVGDLKSQGLNVVNLDRRPPSERWSPFIEVDLTDQGEVYDALSAQKPDAVVHLAADPRPNSRARHAQFMQNVGIAHAVMQASGDLGVERFVYASSEQANGWTSAKAQPQRLPIDEDAMTAPQTAYALSKFVGEVIAASVAAVHPEMAAASLRLNYVVLPENLEKLRGWHPEEHLSWNLWGYVDARDVASAVRLSLACAAKGHRAYNISAQDTLCHIPTRELVERWLGPEKILSEDLPTFGSLVDCSRAREELGWQAEHSWRVETA